MLCNKEKCTGCLACYNICPKNAIDLIEDNQGMERPQINNNKCIKCGLCEQVCPEIHEVKKQKPLYTIALYTKNKFDQSTCASGGVATTFYKYFWKFGGKVFGVGVNGIKPILKEAKTKDDLESFKGSKYVYASPQNIYRIIKTRLIEGYECIFIGTPCQVAGLKSFLQKEYSNLYLIDLVCHGTPPFSVFEKYLKVLLKDNKVSKYSFRCGNRSGLRLEAEEEILYDKVTDEDYYYYAFIKGALHREICYNCKYAECNRVSDITIGDFWGLDEEALNRYRGNKSLMLINTEKGEKIFEYVKENFVYEYRTLDEAIKGNAQLSRPSKRDKSRDKFLEEYIKSGDMMSSIKKCGIEKAVKRNRIRNKVLYFPRKIKYFILGNR